MVTCKISQMTFKYIFPMAIKYSNILQSKALKHLPKLVLLVWKYVCHLATPVRIVFVTFVPPFCTWKMIANYNVLKKWMLLERPKVCFRIADNAALALHALHDTACTACTAWASGTVGTYWHYEIQALQSMHALSDTMSFRHCSHCMSWRHWRHCTTLHGTTNTACHCMVLHGTAWHCMSCRHCLACRHCMSYVIPSRHFKHLHSRHRRHCRHCLYITVVNHEVGYYLK
jgi:hypothetical protein